VDEPTIPQSAAFHIQLPSFEGPLDLLLHLIRKHELDILDLPVAFVTERYLDYLQMMQELDLDVASEYLLMAATLAHIKSKMLLPQTTTADTLEEQDEAYQEDPRAELIRRLLEYQKYKAAADHLGQRPLSGRDVFARGMPAVEAQGPAPLAGIELYKLLDAFQGILKRVSGRVLEVSAERITIHERITQLSELLRLKRYCTFEELFETARTRYEVVVTFLALLEMTKMRMTRVFQTEPSAPLHVQYALLDADAPNDSSTADASNALTDEAPTADMPVPSNLVPSDLWAEGDAPGRPLQETALTEDQVILEPAEELVTVVSGDNPAMLQASQDAAWGDEPTQEFAAGDAAVLIEALEAAADALPPEPGEFVVADAWVEPQPITVDDEPTQRLADVDAALLREASAPPPGSLESEAAGEGAAPMAMPMPEPDADMWNEPTLSLSEADAIALARGASAPGVRDVDALDPDRTLRVPLAPPVAASAAEPEHLSHAHEPFEQDATAQHFAEVDPDDQPDQDKPSNPTN
jgi:segregation and condensation protein A